MLQSAVRILCWSKDALFVGSGFVVGLDGTATYVVTNQHVIDCAQPDDRKLSIILPDRKVDAESVWADTGKDLAVLRTRAPLGRPVAPLADTASVGPGTRVIVVGFPGAADKLVQSTDAATPSMTSGNISRVVRSDIGVRYFEHTAVALAGSSGGPAYDETGAVIGIVTLNAVGAIPSIADGRRSVRYLNLGLGAAVDVAELIPGLQARSVPFTMATVTPMSISTIILLAAVILLLAAGGILVATPAGRALLFGHTAPTARERQFTLHRGRIRVVGGALAGTEMPVHDKVTLGRDPHAAQIVFPEDDTSVSRRHCQIAFDSSTAQFEVRDLGSRNGTFIAAGDNKPRRLVPNIAERVAPGQRILVGSPKNSLTLELG